MSSNNLLSLLEKSQEKRRSSIASRQAVSPTFSFMPRSASRSVQRTPPRDNNKVSTQLYKISHLVNLKVKQSYFFCFCKIEQIAKKRLENKPANTEIPTISEEKYDSTDSKKASKEEIMSEGLTRLCEFESTLSTKVWMREQHNLLSFSFKEIQDRSRTSLFLQKMERLLEVRKNSMKQLFFKGLKIIEKEKIRLQILTDSLEQTMNKSISLAFNKLKLCKREFKKQDVVAFLPVAEETSRKKTVVLKEKKTAIIQPTSLFLGKCRPAPQIHEDKPISTNRILEQSSEEPMKRLLTFKS